MKIDAQSLEKYSSAVTLSDMEIFVFPELLYSLVLANIMSPRIWAWREDPWFAKLERMTPYRRIQRLKQFVIDHYEFNLDLDTWGLTTKECELARFRPWMDEATIGRSNALFGYEGDQYYFDIDIRRHFGLDKYTTDAVPYWKTETVEAMDAFRHRDGYRIGAGECVSLSTLYAAAMFVICGVSLDDIFLMATPLHSQNFILQQDGILTNNRRIVTRNMWFNGTELTAKAQRALRNEQVTVVAHHTGWIHCVYDEATIAPAAYDRFRTSLQQFLSTDITFEVLANFLRQAAGAQPCFQFVYDRHGRPHYLPAEVAYHYEHSSNYRVGGRTQDKLLDEIDDDEFYTEPIEGRVPLRQLEEFLKDHPISATDTSAVDRLLQEMDCDCIHTRSAIRELTSFVHLEPRLPDQDGAKRHAPASAIDLDPAMTREEVIDRVEAQRKQNPVADLAFYAYRDLSRTDWAPFLKAAMERNPVAIEATKDLDDDALRAHLAGLPNESIYDGPRVAQPDEVWNYGRGDGFERAVCLADIWRSRHPEAPIELAASPHAATLRLDGLDVEWPSSKGLSGSAML